MYRGFNLRYSLKKNEKYEEKGRKLFNEYKNVVETNLNKFLLPNKSLNGFDIQNNWFTEIDAHIFLSHSHIDEKTAFILAGWLFEKHELKTFLDSSVWGYSDKLLKIIDNNYCFDKKLGKYNYKERNYSTSHVHLMLKSALTKMIDKCECVFFLNTPNSISSNPDNEMTSSP